jgi:fibronectin type 3 domain-containing protein
LPAYSDHGVEHGKTYRYEVSAIDQKGNESARSAAVEVVFP